MTLVAEPEQVDLQDDRTPVRARSKLVTTLSANKLSVGIVFGLLVACLIATSFNIVGYPIRFKDEGVYLAQAWAIPNMGTLAHYTYWYDHPPMGWIQMSMWAQLTGGWHRWFDNTTMAGREFMVFLRLVTCVLLFVLARRLGMRRFWATIAVLLFIFSPLAMYYGRLVLLDNVAIPWVLASFVLALSPKRTWMASVGSALCFAVAITTKETLVLLAPALLLAIWTNYRDSSNRSFVWVSFGIVLSMSALLYPLYAIIKSELIPGPGHVSLVEAIQWQLGDRRGSGSVFDQNSDARNLVDSWLNLDRWVPISGVIASVPLLFDRRYRPLMLALLVQLAMLLRTGYLPSMFVDTLLPFMVIAIAGLCDKLWPHATQAFDALLARAHDGTIRHVPSWRTVAGLAGVFVVLGYWLTITPPATEEWSNSLKFQWSNDADAPERATIEWLRDNVPHDAVLVSEGELWLDLHNVGFDGPGNIWVYKVDSDPAVTEQLGEWRNIDYLALSETTLISESKDTMPRVFSAIENADKVTEFGTANDKVTIMKVRK